MAILNLNQSKDTIKSSHKTQAEHCFYVVVQCTVVLYTTLKVLLWISIVINVIW
jgi:hypothetical protein